ncbi:uncharacterized protein LOC142227232 [Haematobia irritans]|uniref:uncharacterized protein LOC142227232 n=1 Tax=Haematobia irritans TaxID=7368 RepID=UPI003F5072AF
MMKMARRQKLLIYFCILGLTWGSMATEENETVPKEEIQTMPENEKESFPMEGKEIVPKEEQVNLPTQDKEIFSADEKDIGRSIANAILEASTEVLNLETTSAITETIDETTTNDVPELTTTIPTITPKATQSVPLEIYAVHQMNSILNHLLRTVYTFVSQVLQESQDSDYPRDKLKNYAEHAQRFLTLEEDAEDNIANEEFYYSIMLKKLNFLKSKLTKNLQTYLPEDWVEMFLKNKDDTIIWLDEASDEMHMKFITYVSDEEDHVKHQYFNEVFDDIKRVNLVQIKLAILLDLVKVATNRKHITFMDLYMQ